MIKRQLSLYLLPLLIIVAIGTYLRASGTRSLNLGFNETIHVYAAKSILEHGQPILPSGKVYNRALLFTHSVALSFRLFGVNEFSARLPSIIFGTLSIILVFIIGQQLFTKEVGLIAAFLMAFMPFEIVWSRVCRMYAMYQFFFLFGFFAFYKGYESEKKQTLKTNMARFALPLHLDVNWTWLLLSGLLILVAFHLHSLTLIFGISIFVYSLIMLIINFISSETPSRIFRQKYFLTFILLLSLGVLFLAIPYTSNVARKLYGLSPDWASYLGVSPTRYAKFLVRPMFYPIMAFFVLGVIQVCTRMNKPGLYTLAAAAVPLTFHSFFANVQSPRYIYDILPLLFLIGAYAIHNLCELELTTASAVLSKHFTKHKFIRSSCLALLFCGLLLLFGFPISKAVRLPGRQAGALAGEYNAQWKEACQYVDRLYKPGDVIVVSIPLAADYYGCKPAEYSLDNGEIDQFRNVEGSTFQLHPFANTKAIIYLEDLERVLLENQRGWLLLDAQRFANPATIPTDIREFIVNNLLSHTTEAGRTIHVFTWDETIISKMLNDKQLQQDPLL